LGERFRCGSELEEKLLSELPDSRVRSLPDGTSHGASKLVSLELIPPHIFRRLSVGLRKGRKEISGVEYGIAQKLEDVTKKAVGPRLGDDVHNGPGVLTVLCAIVARLHAEFLKCVRKWERLVDLGVLIHVIAAVSS